MEGLLIRESFSFISTLHPRPYPLSTDRGRAS